MAKTNGSGHIRYRYGMCLNDQCSKAKSKEVQQISSRKDFVCEECGKALRECPPPKKGGNTKVLIAVAAVVILAGGGYGVFSVMSGGEKTGTDVNKEQSVISEVSSDTAKIDSVRPEVSPDTEKIEPVKPKVEKVVTPEPEKKPVKQKVMNGRGTVDLGYGTYTGDLKNGKPHGYGTITYKQAHKIVASKDFVAQPGDKFEGEFRDGRISGLGYWKHDGNETAVKP